MVKKMFKLKDHITIIQNFVCTNKARLDMLLGQIPDMAKAFGDAKFIVNYNTEKNLEIIKKCYKDNIKNLEFHNDLTKDWGKTMLNLLKSCETERVAYFCEDFEYLNKHERWKNIFEEVVEKDVNFLVFSKIEKYAKRKEYVKNYEHGENIYLYNSKNSPSEVLSIDAMYKKDFLIERLNEYVDCVSDKSPVAYEKYYKGKQGIRRFDISCAIPKEVVALSYNPGGQREGMEAATSWRLLQVIKDYDFNVEPQQQSWQLDFMPQEHPVPWAAEQKAAMEQIEARRDLLRKKNNAGEQG